MNGRTWRCGSDPNLIAYSGSEGKAGGGLCCPELTTGKPFRRGSVRRLKSVRPVSLAGCHPPAASSDTGQGCDKPEPVSTTMENVRELDTESTRAILSGLAIQQRERQTSLQRLVRLRKEASAEIDRLIAFLDASDPYVTTELEEQVDDGAIDDTELDRDDSDDEDNGDDEPSLGSGAVGEWSTQAAWVTPQARACLDGEDEHDGAEPDEDGEPSLGSFEGLMHDQEVSYMVSGNAWWSAGADIEQDDCDREDTTLAD